MKMTFEVNNRRSIEVFQARADGPVYTTVKDEKGQKESGEIIKPGDFITMLNWYRYQKSIGNENLYFEGEPRRVKKESVESRAVKIAAKIMQAAGLCRYESATQCKKLYVDEATCDNCIKTWLLSRAKREMADRERGK